ncbi:uncharacterized protein CBL_12742 [Carabus blaptoides fortunei]
MDNPRTNINREIILRAILFFTYMLLGWVKPFERKIQSEEIWLHRYPLTKSYVPNVILWPVLFGFPLAAILVNSKFERNPIDIREAVFCLTLSMGVTGVTTNILKVITGRLRPDFFSRCFPNGKISTDMVCNGEPKLILEGRKSFPSGHSSLSFASMTFLTLYLMAKLRIFDDNGRGKGWRIVVCVLPLVLASCIAISRSCDYHHHEEDIVAGSLLGIAVAYFCYRQYYPSFRCLLSHTSYAALKLRQ